MYFGAPQIIILVLIIVGLGINLAKHGEPKNENSNFWISLTNATVTLGLLYWGGFFS